MAIKLLNKDEERSFKDLEELKEFAYLREQNYSWVEFDTASSEYVPLEDMPICVPVIRDELGISSEVSNDTIVSQMQDTKLALSYPVYEKSTRDCYPVGPTAYKGLLERVGATCSALSSLKDTRKMDEVSPSDKATICNLLKKYTKGKSLLLLGDEMVLADLSSDYVRIPFSEILKITEHELKSNFEFVMFIDGRISHESSLIEFKFIDDEIDSNLYDAFTKIGLDISDYSAHIIVMTSDVGLSGANVYPFIRSESNGDVIQIGTPIKLEHIGDANTDKFRENLLSCFASFKEASDHLDEMSKIRIANPADCLYNIGKKISLPEKYLRELCEEFDNEYPYSCNGIHIYVKLFEVLDNYVTSSEEKISDIRYMQLSENITRICFYSMIRFDMPVIK